MLEEQVEVVPLPEEDNELQANPNDHFQITSCLCQEIQRKTRCLEHALQQRDHALEQKDQWKSKYQSQLSENERLRAQIDWLKASSSEEMAKIKRELARQKQEHKEMNQLLRSQLNDKTQEVQTLKFNFEKKNIENSSSLIQKFDNERKIHKQTQNELKIKIEENAALNIEVLTLKMNIELQRDKIKNLQAQLQARNKDKYDLIQQLNKVKQEKKDWNRTHQDSHQLILRQILKKKQGTQQFCKEIEKINSHRAESLKKYKEK